MSCEDFRRLLHAYADDELDLLNAGRVDRHLEECGGCRDSFEAVMPLKSAAANPALYFPAPAALRRRVLAEVRRSARSHTWQLPRWWWTLALAATVLVVLGTSLLTYVDHARSATRMEASAVLAAHLRSLQPGHAYDVVSTDQHTVKPWFDKATDFSPPVFQLQSDGFPLQGGRLDYLNDRPVAALVYGHGAHLINLFVWPGESGSGTFSDRGFNLLHWSASGMTFWAVSDTSLHDLQQFADLIRSHASATAR